MNELLPFNYVYQPLCFESLGDKTESTKVDSSE